MGWGLFVASLPQTYVFRFVIHELQMLHTCTCFFFSALLKTLMLFITAQVFRTLRHPHSYPNVILLQLLSRALICVFLTESNLHTVQEYNKLREKCCELIQTGANAYLFH